MKTSISVRAYEGRRRVGSPAHTTHRTNAGLMLGQRRRRWPNIKPTFVQCVVFIREWSAVIFCELLFITLEYMEIWHSVRTREAGYPFARDLCACPYA